MIISPSAKVYIGQSINIERRFNAYKNPKCSAQVKLYASLMKYGVESHMIDIIEYCSIDQLNERERHWQDEYDAIGEYGMNCKLTTAESKSGKLSDEIKQKISQAIKGKSLSEETKMKMSECKKGHSTSDETRKKLSEAFKGRKLSDETKQKIKEGMKKKRVTTG